LAIPDASGEIAHKPEIWGGSSSVQPVSTITPFELRIQQLQIADVGLRIEIGELKIDAELLQSKLFNFNVLSAI